MFTRFVVAGLHFFGLAAVVAIVTALLAPIDAIRFLGVVALACAGLGFLVELYALQRVDPARGFSGFVLSAHAQHEPTWAPRTRRLRARSGEWTPRAHRDAAITMIAKRHRPTRRSGTVRLSRFAQAQTLRRCDGRRRSCAVRR